MTSIKDETFVRTLYRRFCLRGVSDRASRYAIQTRRIEVHDLGDNRLKVSICDREGSLIDIGWNTNVAWAMRVHPFDEALRDADERKLTNFVRRFLLKHRVIDTIGLPIKRGAA